jgi:hypothetical protein
MNGFGKHINVKFNQNKEEFSEKELFSNIILTLDECWKRTRNLEENIGLNISGYDETFYLIIENLIHIYYGEWKSEVILWWVFERFDENGNLLPIVLNDIDENLSEEVIVNTPEELWDLLKKIEKI